MVTLSSSLIRGPVFHPIDDYEHPLLYLPGTGIDSQETAISGSFQHNLACICNSVCIWWLIMGWIPHVRQSLDGPSFRLSSKLWLCNSLHRSFVPNSKKGEVSTLWSSFFLSFMCLANYILYLGYPRFGANIHLSVSTYCVSSFVIGLPYSG